LVYKNNKLNWLSNLFVEFGSEGSFDGSNTGFSLLEGSLGFVVRFVGVFLFNFLGSRWISTDGSVSFGVDGFNIFWSDIVLDVLAEKLFVSFFVVSLENFHVISDVTTENVFTEDFSV